MKAPVSPGYRFGDCELWPAQRLLLRCGHAQVLGGRAFDLLLVLVENSHRLMPKDTLLEQVWPGLAVEPNNLQVQVWALRQLLGHRAIATVARRGYRFMLPVQAVALPPAGGNSAAAPGLAETRPGAAWHDWAAPLQAQPLLTLVGDDSAALRQLAEALALHRRGARPAPLWRIEACNLGCGRRTRAVPDVDDRLWQQLARQPGQLLLLDCHRAMPAARALVRAARTAAPGLQLLATAAAPLGLPAEVLAGPPPHPGACPAAPAPPGIAPGLRWRPRSGGKPG